MTVRPSVGRPTTSLTSAYFSGTTPKPSAAASRSLALGSSPGGGVGSATAPGDRADVKLTLTVVSPTREAPIRTGPAAEKLKIRTVSC